MDEKTTLVSLLAAQDAPCLAIRGHEWEGATAVYLARMGQISIRGGLTGAALERQNKSRLTAKLMAEGLVRRVSREKLALTPLGERIARALCWPVSPAEYAEACSRLESAVASGLWFDGLSGQSWVCETHLCGVPWDNRSENPDFGLLGVCFAPLIHRGIVAVGSTTKGQACYALVGELPSDPDFIDNAASTFDESMADHYGEELRTTRRQIVSHSVTSPGEIGDLPLHIGPLKSSRGYNDVAETDLLFV